MYSEESLQSEENSCKNEVTEKKKERKKRKKKSKSSSKSGRTSPKLSPSSIRSQLSTNRRKKRRALHTPLKKTIISKKPTKTRKTYVFEKFENTPSSFQYEPKLPSSNKSIAFPKTRRFFEVEKSYGYEYYHNELNANPHLRIRPTSSGFRMSKAKRFDYRVKDKIPGPVYNLKDLSVKKNFSQVSFGKGERFRNTFYDPNYFPGPGKYNTLPLLESNGTTFSKNVKLKLLDTGRLNFPGPGKYNTVKEERISTFRKLGKNYGFSKERKLYYRRPKTPGPGFYKVRSRVINPNTKSVKFHKTEEILFDYVMDE